MKYVFYARAQRIGRHHSGVPHTDRGADRSIRPAGHLRKVQPGEILFSPNDTGVPFFVLLSGNMEIVQPS